MILITDWIVSLILGIAGYFWLKSANGDLVEFSKSSSLGLVLIIEVVIALYIDDNFVRPYLGDVLVIFLMYAFIKSFIGLPTKRLPYYLLAFAVFVEVLQLFDFLTLLNIEASGLASIALGRVFDMKDIVCYLIGAGLLLVYEQVLRKDISYL